MRFRNVGALTGFRGPLRALVMDASDRLFVADGARIQSFAGDRPSEGFAAARPVCSLGLAGGLVYAGESGQVEIFDKSGKLVNTWRGLGVLGEITSIGFFGSDVFLGDAAGRSILRCDAKGNVLGRIGNNNRLRGFHVPNGVLDFDIDDGGVLHAANPGKHRVERYTAAGELLGHVGRFDGVNPEGFCGCCNPTNVTLGASGRLYVTEKAGARAKVLDRDGHLLGVIGTDIFHPASKNMDIAVDRRGRVYVADTAQLRVAVFEEVAA